MTGDDRRALPPSDPVDPLALAEAVAAGRLTLVAAEAALREAGIGDPRRTDADLAELRDLVVAIRGVRRHVDVTRRADALDTDTLAAPLGSAGPLEDDRRVAPSRVHPGDVRLRPASRPGAPRWAPVGALAAAAVVVVAVALIAPGLLNGPVATSPSPSASQVVLGSPSVSASPSASPSLAVAPSPSPSPSATPIPTARATGVPGVPPIPSEPLVGARAIAYWTLAAEDRITVSSWAPDGSAPAISFTASTWPDPARGDGVWIDRRVVASPDGRRVAFTESVIQPPLRQRLRVFAADGTLLWTDPKPTNLPELAWSPDGNRLVVGSVPATWKMLTFAAGGGAPTVTTRDFPGAAYSILGFSTSGAVLYGWDTNGEADWWMTPFQIVVPSGKPVQVTRFSGKAEPLGISNGTTPGLEVDPSNGTWTSLAGVDPVTGRVLDIGDLSGRLNGWEVRDGSSATKLDGIPAGTALSWGPNGSIVVIAGPEAATPLTMTTVDPGSPTIPVSPIFSASLAGGFWSEFEGVRGSFALLGLGADRAHDSLYLGADELVAVDLSTGRSAVFVPGDPGLTGIHVAGWITAP